MTATEISTAEIIQALEAACEDRWGIWLSDTGRWWAVRDRSLTVSDFNAGCVPFLRADSPAELADAIREQDGLCAAIGQPAKETRPASDTPGKQPDQSGLDDLNCEFGDRYDFTNVEGGFRADRLGAHGIPRLPLYGRTPGELAEAIRHAEGTL